MLRKPSSQREAIVMAAYASLQVLSKKKKKKKF